MTPLLNGSAAATSYSKLDLPAEKPAEKAKAAAQAQPNELDATDVSDEGEAHGHVEAQDFVDSVRRERSLYEAMQHVDTVYPEYDRPIHR